VPKKSRFALLVKYYDPVGKLTGTQGRKSCVQIIERN
jgi:hypothetical protein